MSRPRHSLALGFGAVVLCLTTTACLEVAGSGTVTITSTTPASVNTIAYVCPGVQSSCGSTDPYEYTYRPQTGISAVTVSPGFPVEDGSGNTVPLPSRQYTVGVFDGFLSSLIVIDVYSTQDRDLTIWHKAIGRESEQASCPDGWGPSWAKWPNGGTGGFVCSHQSYAYYPDTPVATGQSPSTPWLQSIARADADADCPSGYRPSWAQWPNEQAGGFTCTLERR